MQNLETIALLATVVVLGLTIWSNVRILKELKRIDITRNYQLRYDQLLNQRPPTKGKGAKRKSKYWESYWRLQDEQFYFFLRNMVDRDRYARWLKERRREYNDEDKGEAYKENWENNKHYVLYDDFRDFMTKVLNSEDLIEDILSEARKDIRWNLLTLREKLARIREKLARIWEWIK